MTEVTISAKASFQIEVPYEVIDTGPSRDKPLIVYLHGYKQNLVSFKERMSDLLSLRAYHLFIQGPYPIYDEKHTREVAKWGRAWYLYDRLQSQFTESMERTSILIQSIIDEVSSKLSIQKKVILGYSMGGYLAGYFALSRPDYITGLVVVGARIKTEHFRDQSFTHLNVLALHGDHDETVSAANQRKSCDELKRLGAAVTYRNLDEGHRLNSVFVSEIRKWLIN